MKTIATFFIIFILSNGYTQTKDSSNKTKKHLIGIEIGAPISLYLGQLSNEFGTSFQYKYSFNEKWRLRSSVSYERYGSGSHTSFKGDGKLIKITDSTFQEKNSSSGGFAALGKIGIERTFKIKSFDLFIGAEIFGGKLVSNQSEKIETHEYIIGEEIHFNSFYNSSSIVTSTHSNSLRYGGSLILGTEWNFAKRFSLGTQISLDVLLTKNINSSIGNYIWENGESVSSEFMKGSEGWNNSQIEVSYLKLFLNFRF